MPVAHRGGEAVLPSSATGREAGDLLGLAPGHLHSAALHSAARFGIADHLVEGPRTADEPAEAARGPNCRHVCPAQIPPSGG